MRSGSSAKLLRETVRSTRALEVSSAAVRVDERAVGEPAGHRVDREVAAREILLHRRRRVDDDLEVVPPRPGRDLAARRCELDPGRNERAQLAVARVVAHTHGAAGDDELLGAAVRRERGAQAVDVDAGHEEVRVLRVDAEQFVADRAADDVGVEPERADVLLDLLQTDEAIASISTSAPDGSFATSTVDRAGGVSPT